MIDIRDFGAVGDGKTNDTVAIQRAFDEGSRRRENVLIPQGIYLAGTLHLRDHLHIELAPEGTLLGSTDIRDYVMDPHPDRTAGLRTYLLWGQNINDFSITGTGTINGSGRAFWEDTFFDGDADTERDEDVPFGPLTRHLLKPKDPRPVLLYMENCQNITLDSFRILNSPSYTVWLIGCAHICIQNLTVRNMHKGPNTDVLDLDCSTDMIVRNCDLDAGDDCIAVKSDTYRIGRDQYCGDLLVEDCTLRSVTCGIRIGYEGDGAIRNCTFKRLTIIDTRHGIHFDSITPGPIGLGLVIKKGCPISDILFEDITIKNSAQAFYLWTGDSGKTGTFTGFIRDIIFRNITAEQHWGSYFGCTTTPCISNIAFQNVHVRQLSPLAPQSPDYIPCNWASNELGAVLTLKQVQNFTIDGASSLTAPEETQLIQIS